MKNSLFDMLIDFFEKSLMQISEKKSRMNSGLETREGVETDSETMFVNTADDQSIRVFTYEEQMKLTKASYQFLMRLLLWGVIASGTMELIINQLLLSESPYVTLSETKWIIRNTLAEHLDAAQLAFLDLVLYQKEDALPLH